MLKIAYLHNLPLEYYPPASNLLDILGRQAAAQVRAFTTTNRKGRAAYANPRIRIDRSHLPDPEAHGLVRFLRAVGWHLKTALSLARFRPDAVVYVEPHSAIAVWIYFRLLRGKGRLFIHHHEYYAPGDYRRPGMRLPRLGYRFEHGYLFGRAEWISQTNPDRVALARQDAPDLPAQRWRVLPNYPPSRWGNPGDDRRTNRDSRSLKLVYLGSASFEDSYIREIVTWVAGCQGRFSLHIVGYNVEPGVWEWLEQTGPPNVSWERRGCDYHALPELLRDFDIGLVLYKGNTTNFVFNVPNKVFEYLRVGLEVWYPRVMTGMRHFAEGTSAPLRELDFSSLDELDPGTFTSREITDFDAGEYTAERAFAPLLLDLGLKQDSMAA